MSFKQAIILRSDLGMGKGKLAAQAAHASLAAYKEANASARKAWENGGQEKIALKASSEGELQELFILAKREKLPAVLIRDAGHTQVAAGSMTALAIGPAEEAKVDLVTGKLKLL